MYIRLIDSTLRENEYLFRLNDQQKVYFTIFYLLQLGFDDNMSQHQVNRTTVNLHSMSHFEHIQTKSSRFHLRPKLTHHLCLQSVEIHETGQLFCVSEFLKVLLEVYFSNSLIIHQVKTKEVWIPSPN